jgi:uncharacterized SAM-binding protein YcdF (DUF218 family)
MVRRFIHVLRVLGRALRSVWLRRAVGAALLLWVLSVALLTAAMLAYSRVDRAQAADVIIVLGAGLQPNNQPGPALTRRAAQGAALWHDGLAAQIVCSGGVGLNRVRSEADACAELLRAAGVPDTAIVLEDRSRSTEENALYTQEIMQANGWTSAVLVSDGYHLLRAHWLFNRVGIANYPSPAADPPPNTLLASSLRELAAFHWLAFKTVLNLPVTYVPLV